MRRSHVNILLHFAWATKERAHLIPQEHEDAIHDGLRAEAARVGCVPLAVGGTENHVHMLLSVPATVTAADAMRKIKGVSSAAAKERGLAWFQWQDNYGVTSVSPRDKELVTRYILEQRERHRTGCLLPGAEVLWEELGEKPEE
jgi:putative transposase